LVKNIETKPLVIDSALKPTTRDFLEKTLKINEKERLSWDEVFLHPIFKGYFHTYAEQNQ
jgi:calcium-dependent protein kinase